MKHLTVYASFPGIKLSLQPAQKNWYSCHLSTAEAAIVGDRLGQSLALHQHFHLQLSAGRSLAFEARGSCIRLILTGCRGRRYGVDVANEDIPRLCYEFRSECVEK